MPLDSRIPHGRRARCSRVPRHASCLQRGVLVMFLALATPLDTLGDSYLFTAHMLQHLLLTLVAAPLLLVGTPGWLLRACSKHCHLTGFVRWAHHPLVAFFGFNVIFSLAHVPAFYELTLANEPLHALEHLVFVGTAMLMWMPVLSPVPDISAPYPALGQVLYLFLQTVPASLVGALLSATGSAYYPTYVLAPRITSLSPLEDQQLGGLLMWVGGGTYFLIAIRRGLLRVGRPRRGSQPAPARGSLRKFERVSSMAVFAFDGDARAYPWPAPPLADRRDHRRLRRHRHLDRGVDGRLRAGQWRGRFAGRLLPPLAVAADPQRRGGVQQRSAGGGARAARRARRGLGAGLCALRRSQPIARLVDRRRPRLVARHALRAVAVALFAACCCCPRRRSTCSTGRCRLARSCRSATWSCI